VACSSQSCREASRRGGTLRACAWWCAEGLVTLSAAASKRRWLRRLPWRGAAFVIRGRYAVVVRALRWLSGFGRVVGVLCGSAANVVTVSLFTSVSPSCSCLPPLARRCLLSARVGGPRGRAAGGGTRATAAASRTASTRLRRGGLCERGGPAYVAARASASPAARASRRRRAWSSTRCARRASTRRRGLRSWWRRSW
jgi:hypothetical protein